MSRQRLGGCRLERILSHSEHSELYRAWSEELQRPVMIKVLAARYPPNSRTARRFLRGGKLAMELEHPNIVRTFHAGEEKGRPHMLMEYVDGHSLDRILKVKERLPWEIALGIVRQVAKALDGASEKNIVHRSIEPSHIMLSPGGRVRMLGFGLARLAEAQEAAITAEGALINVGPYSPPETGEGVLDTRGDLYSLGCVFYHMISGKPPFDGNDPLMLLHHHRTEEPWPITDLVPQMPESMGPLFEMLLAKQLAKRVQSPADLIALIDAVVNPEILGAQGVKPDKTMVASTMQMLAVRHKFTVLVCDDQESTLRCLKETLRRLGITVLATRDGQAALETIASRDIDLVLTDVKVPRVWGRQLIEQIRGLKPDLPLILSRTGSLAESFFANESYRITSCLARPLDLFTLRRSVEAVLQEQAED